MVFLGRLTRSILLWTNWHSKFPILNLYNKWWYVFNGYYNNLEETDLVFVDIVVDTKDRTVIYSGFLINFDFVNGELERLYLRDTLKRDFVKGSITASSEETTSTTKPYEIIGDLFSIAYKNILNINIHFISIDTTLEEIQQLPDLDESQLPEENA